MSSAITLDGCRPEPMASYLKALGVLRLVAEQDDATARGYWRDGVFTLASRLDREELLSFFCERYRPTPIVAPWNGGSGFHDKDNRLAIDAIVASNDPRFGAYRAAIETCRTQLRDLAIAEKPSPDEKAGVLQRLRANLDDDALKWIDAAVALSANGPSYPPLLGTGGNDGRLDFSNNQMQRLVALFAMDDEPRRRLLRATLLGEPASRLERCAIGQFSPAAAGGANAGRGYSRDSLVNPWEYVLLLEGALLFAASVTRRAESNDGGSLAFPFSVRAAGIGYGSGNLCDEDESRDELWLPLWSRPATLPELAAVFVEGRAKVAGHAVKSGVDFARAVATLGVDRGLDAFVRYGFHVRNGLSYFATPLGLWRVARHKPVDIVAEIDPWLNALRRFAAGGPAAVKRALRATEEAVLDLSLRGDAAATVALAVALGDAEYSLSRSRGRADRSPGPVPQLSRRWLDLCGEDDVELRLALGLASSGIREHLVPIDPAHPRQWLANDDRRAVWRPGDLVASLLAVLARRQIDAEHERKPPKPRRYCSLADVAAFIRGDVDDRRLEALCRGLAIVEWRTVVETTTPQTPDGPQPPAAFAALKLAHYRELDPELTLRATPGLLAHGAAGRCRRATELAVRRLAGAGVRPALSALDEPPETTRRLTAALAFPLSLASIHELRERITLPKEKC